MRWTYEPECEEMERYGNMEHCQSFSSLLCSLLAAAISELYHGRKGAQKPYSNHGLAGTSLSRMSDKVEFSWMASSVAVCARHNNRG